MLNNQRVDGILMVLMVIHVWWQSEHIGYEIHAYENDDNDHPTIWLYHPCYGIWKPSPFRGSWSSCTGLSDRIVGCRLRLAVGLEEEIGRPHSAEGELKSDLSRWASSDQRAFRALVSSPYPPAICFSLGTGKWPIYRWFTHFRNGDSLVPELLACLWGIPKSQDVDLSLISQILPNNSLSYPKWSQNSNGSQHQAWWFQSLWKIRVSQLGWWHSQYMESHKIHVPKHQPEPAKKTSQTKTTANDLFDPSGPMITSPPPSGMVLRTLRQLPQTAKFFGEITACDGGYGRGYGYIYITYSIVFMGFKHQLITAVMVSLIKSYVYRVI